MIVLTGDLHHQSLNTGNQQHCDLTELEVAQRYLGLLEETGTKVTFFISGKCFEEQWDEVRPIVRSELVELGGHNYSCFTPELWHRVSKKLLGSYNGPEWYQRWDAERTIRIIEQHTGRRIRVWRNHMYMHGPYTERVLAGLGIRVCSDGVKRDSLGLEPHAAGIYNLPINVIPDHEHLYHAERTREWVANWQRRYSWSDDFGPDSYDIDEWVEIAIAGIHENEARGAVSTIIVHPITMFLCDRFEGFRRLLKVISEYECVHVGDLLERSASGTGIAPVGSSESAQAAE